jgi:hypothetical protein
MMRLVQVNNWPFSENRKNFSPESACTCGGLVVGIVRATTADVEVVEKGLKKAL